MIVKGTCSVRVWEGGSVLEGEYDPQEEILNDCTVYRKRGAPNIFIEYQTEKKGWCITSGENRGTSKCLAYAVCDPPRPLDAVADLKGSWQLFSGGKFTTSPELTVTRGDLVNRAGVRCSIGTDVKVFYCNRVLGRDAIPGSDGRCGPNDGPQCRDCQGYTPTNLPPPQSSAEAIPEVEVVGSVEPFRGMACRIKAVSRSEMESMQEGFGGSNDTMATHLGQSGSFVSNLILPFVSIFMKML